TLVVFGSTIQNSTAPSPARVVMALPDNSSLVFEGDFTSITSSGEPISHFSALSFRDCVSEPGTDGVNRDGGVNPVAETRKLRTGYHSLTGNCQRSCSSAYWSRLVKRRRALLESNPPRNSQLETHRGR